MFICLGVISIDKIELIKKGKILSTLNKVHNSIDNISNLNIDVNVYEWGSNKHIRLFNTYLELMRVNELQCIFE